MASAYELMLVLRGRNYLSNDLRRAGADIGRLKSQAGLTNARSQLQVNAQRLASTKAIAQAETTSIRSGQRSLALQKARATYTAQHLAATKKLTEAENALNANSAARVRNAEQLAAVQNKLGLTPAGSNNAAALTEMQRKLATVDRELIVEQARLNDQLLIAQNTMAKVAVTEQQLIATETAHAQRLAVLTDRINTTDAALELNTIKLNENALAMKRLPLEKLGARAQYVEHLGRAFQTLGLVSVAALGYAAHAASQFNTQLTLASTQATVIGDRSVAKVQQNSAMLQKAVQDMLIGGKTAAKPADLTGGLYTIFSGLSLPGNQTRQLKEGVGILKEFNKVFTANYGQVTFNDVTKAGVALINNFGLSAGKIPQVMNQMQASVRFGAMTMSEMTASLNQVIPAFKGAGYSTKQMFADIAFVSRIFPSLRQGTTGLARLTDVFAKYHAAISQDVGVNIAPGGRLSPIAVIVQEIIKAHPQLAKGGVDLQNYFKTVTGATSTAQARKAFVGYATQLGLYRDVAGKVMHDNHELDKSFTDMSQTPQVRWAEFTNQLRGLVLEIGTNAMPVFQKFAKPIQDAVKWFDQLSPATKKAIGTFATWAAVGMLFGGTALIIVGALGRMYAAIRLFFLGKAGLAALEGGFASTGVALRLGLLGALILAIPLIVRYHTQIGHLINRLGGLKTVLGLVAGAIIAVRLAPLINDLGLAALKAGTLRNRMIFLSKMSAISIGVSILISTHGSKGAKGFFESLMGGALVGAGIGGVPGALIGSALSTAPYSYKLGQDIRHKVLGIKDVKNLGIVPKQFQTSASTIQAYLDGLRGDTSPSDMSSSAALAAYIAGRKAAGTPVHTTNKAAARTIRAAAVRAAGGPAPFTDADVTAAVKNIVKLDALAKSTNTLENYKKARAALNNLQKKANKDQFAAAQDLISALESQQSKADKKSVSAAKKAAAERVQALKDAASNAMGMYDSLLSQNESVMGQLFSGPYINSPQVQNRIAFGGKLTGTDYLKDLKSQTSQFRTFYAQIAKLQRRGAPQELIQQLIQAGPSALPAIKALSSMGAGQWGQYIKVFKDGQKLLHKQTMIQLTAQLKDYRKYGEKIALQIISGMRDKRLGLANEIQSIIKQIFGVDVPVVTGPHKKNLAAATKAAKQHSGKTPHGVYSPNKTNTNPVVGTNTRTTQSVERHTHYHVTAPTSEHTSIKTQLRHADFAAKAKYERTR
jgi:hypothetical protein